MAMVFARINVPFWLRWKPAVFRVQNLRPAKDAFDFAYCSDARNFFFRDILLHNSNVKQNLVMFILC